MAIAEEYTKRYFLYGRNKGSNGKDKELKPMLEADLTDDLWPLLVKVTEGGKPDPDSKTTTYLKS
eukprot:4374085-Prymnesium_polylepis.1